MTVKFLILKRKGKIMFVAAFYVLTTILIISRLWNAIYYYATCEKAPHCHAPPPLTQTTFYAKVLIELFQIGQLGELAIQVKMTA